MNKGILSPINQTENSIQFYLNGRVFEMIGSEINELEVNKLSADFVEKIRAIQTFSFTKLPGAQKTAKLRAHWQR